MGIVLIQKSKGSGLATSMGGLSDSVLGPGAGGTIKKATTVLAIFFMISSTTLAWMSMKTTRSVVSEPEKAQTPAVNEAMRKQINALLELYANQGKDASAAAQSAQKTAAETTKTAAETTLPAAVKQEVQQTVSDAPQQTVSAAVDTAAKAASDAAAETQGTPQAEQKETQPVQQEQTAPVQQ